MTRLKKNKKEEIVELLETKLEIAEDYDSLLQILEQKREKLYDKQTDEYFECLRKIEMLEEEKKNKEIKILKKCRHNLFYIKQIEQEEDEYKVTAECACCSKKLIEEKPSIIKSWYDNSMLICGYNNSLFNSFIEPKYYLGENVKEKIEYKYLEICSQIIALEEAFKEMGYDKYRYLIKSPEEVIVEYYKGLFNCLDSKNIKQKPIYMKKKTKKQYL